MSPGIDLFSVHIRISVSRPPVDLLCQTLDVNKEKVLWVDGMTMEVPMLLPIASVVECIEYRGTFRDFLTLHMREATEVLQASGGQHSPTLIARAVQLMSRDRNLSGYEALNLVVDEALDMLDADRGDAEIFYRQAQSVPVSIASV